MGDVDAAFGKVCDVFGFRTLNEHQKNALKFLITKKKDVFANLPTGFGNYKSVIFRCCMHVWNQAEKKIYSNRRFSGFSPRKPGEGPN